MGDQYTSVNSPGGMSDDRFEKLSQETSKGISGFNQVTRSIAQKMSLFNTPQDTRSNHDQVKELVDKGQKLVSKIKRRLQELTKAARNADGPQARRRRTQLKKLSSDFKNQLRIFEDTCKRLTESERQSVDDIRRSSSSFQEEMLPSTKEPAPHQSGKSKAKPEFSNYNEDQIYAQANVTLYDEDDLAKREEDIIHITHQMKEVNAAFQEIDGLVQDQGEAVIEIAENTQEAKDNTSAAVEQVREADKRTKFCSCSRTKMMLYSGLGLLVAILVVSLISTLS